MSVAILESDLCDSSITFSVRIRSDYTVNLVGYKFAIYDQNHVCVNAVRGECNIIVSSGERYDSSEETMGMLSANTTYTLEAWYFTDNNQTESDVTDELKGIYEFTTYSPGQTDFLTIKLRDGYPSQTDAVFDIAFDENERCLSYRLTYQLNDSAGNLIESYTDERYSNSSWCAFEGLTPGTSYQLSVSISCYRNSNLTDLWDSKTGYLSFRTESFSGSGTADPPDISNVVIHQDDASTTGTEIGFFADGFDVDYPDVLRVTFFVAEGSSSGNVFEDKPMVYTSPGNSSTEVVVVDGLKPGTEYYVAATITTSDGNEQVTSWFMCETLPPDDSILPDFSSVSILCSPEINSLFVRLSGLSTTGYEYGDFEIVWRIYNADDNPLVDEAFDRKEDVASLGEDISDGVTFSGLAQDVEYYIEARIYYRYAGSRKYDTIGGFFFTKEDISYKPNFSNVQIDFDADVYSETELGLYITGLDNVFSGEWDFLWEIYLSGSSSRLNFSQWSENGGISKSQTAYFSNLSPGTEYLVKVTATYISPDGSTGSHTLSGTYTTAGEIEPDDSGGGVDEAYLVVSGSSNGTTISARLSGLDTNYSASDRTIVWYLNDSYSGEEQLDPYIPQTGTHEFAGLSPNTRYLVKCIVRYFDSSGNMLEIPFSQYFTTNNPEDEKRWYGVHKGTHDNIDSQITTTYTLTSGDMFFVGFSCAYDGIVTVYSNATKDTIGYLTDELRYSTADGVPTNILTSDDDSNGNGNFLFTYSVTAGTQYYVLFRFYSYTNSGSITITIEPPVRERPEYFSWDNEKVSGGDFNITAMEWCALLNHINLVRTYHGFPEISEGTDVSNFTYPEPNDDFLALHYNQALNGITGMNGTGYNENAVQPGWDITADRINFLRNLLNEVIDATI